MTKMFVISNFGHCDLFVICDLEFVICNFLKLIHKILSVETIYTMSMAISDYNWTARAG